MAYFMITLSNWLGRITTNDHPWLHILYDNAASKYDRTFTYRYSRHYHRIREDEYVVADCYRLTLSSKLRIIQVMTQSINLCVVRYPYIVTNGDATSIVEIASEVYR